MAGAEVPTPSTTAWRSKGTHSVQVLDAGAQPLLDLSALLSSTGVGVDVAVVAAKQNPRASAQAAWSCPGAQQPLGKQGSQCAGTQALPWAATMRTAACTG